MAVAYASFYRDQYVHSEHAGHAGMHACMHAHTHASPKYVYTLDSLKNRRSDHDVPSLNESPLNLYPNVSYTSKHYLEFHSYLTCLKAQFHNQDSYYK